MKMITVIFMVFFFFYGIFSLFKGVSSGDQTNLTAQNTNSVSGTKKLSTSLSPKKDETKEYQSMSTPSEKTQQPLNTQIIKAVITFDDGLVPNSFSVKVNVPVRFEIDSKDDVEGCMSTIMIPGLYDKPILIKAGEKIVMEFTPKRVGFYDITCAMGVPWGDIRVE